MRRGKAAYIFLPLGAFVILGARAFIVDGQRWGWDNVDLGLLAFRAFVIGLGSAAFAVGIAWLYNRAIKRHLD